METKNYWTLAELAAELKPIIEEKKTLHETDGLFGAEDIKVIVDMFRKSIEQRQGSDFASGRVNLEQIASGVGKHYGKTFEITRADKYDYHPTVGLKETK